MEKTHTRLMGNYTRVSLKLQLPTASLFTFPIFSLRSALMVCFPDHQIFKTSLSSWRYNNEHQEF